MEHHRLKRPPAAGDMHKTAVAQAITLRPQLRMCMQTQNLSVEDVSRATHLDAATLAAFLDGSAINPRWQQKLQDWLEHTNEYTGKPRSE